MTTTHPRPTNPTVCSHTFAVTPLPLASIDSAWAYSDSHRSERKHPIAAGSPASIDPSEKDTSDRLTGRRHERASCLLEHTWSALQHSDLAARSLREAMFAFGCSFVICGAVEAIEYEVDADLELVTGSRSRAAAPCQS